MTTLDPKQLTVTRKKFYTPSLDEVGAVLQKGLQDYFSEVNVEVVDCPDLTRPPFNLANIGLNGKPRIVEFGSVANISPYVDYTKIYDVTDVPSLVDLDVAFVIGATTGTHTFLNGNTETIINVNIGKNGITQKSLTGRLLADDKTYVQETLPQEETRFSFLGNFFVSEGKPGPVLKVHVRKRIAKRSFIKSIRNTLVDHYKENVIGLGGTFLLKAGKIKVHLMPDYFSDKPIMTNEAVDEWFKFFEMSAPMTGVGELTTGDHGMDLRDQHFHTFSDHGDVGHYRNDTTPDIVEYEGYFNIAEYAYRIDEPIGLMKWSGFAD